MRNLTVEQMENMKSTSWVKHSFHKDNSIIKKASKQKFYDITVTFGDDTPIKKTGVWALNIEEAKEKAFHKHFDLNVREINVVQS